MKHDELAADLAAHLRGSSSRITWEDMQLGPSGSPRPDVYTMEPTYTRLSFEAFECKVSVSDFRADVTAGKWQSYLKYANSVTFAVPHGLIPKEAVPAQCGLIVRGPSGAWRYQKKPTRSVLTEIPWQAWVKLLLDGTHRASQSLKRDRWNSYMSNLELGKKFGEEVGKMLSDLQGLPGRYEFELGLHEERVAALKRSAEDERLRRAEQRKDDEHRCSDDLGRLALALGLPADAIVRDLQGRARQILGLLGRSEWERHPLISMADRMDELAAQLRQTGEALRHREKEPTA